MIRTLSSEQPGDDCPEHLGQTRHGDWAAYKHLDFGAGLGWFEAELASATDGGTVEVRLDHPAGPRIGQVSAGHTGGWQSWQTVRAPVTPVPGVHALYPMALA